MHRLIALIIVPVLLGTGLVMAGEKELYRDIYLTGNRVCKACTAQRLGKLKVALTNREGASSVVDVRDIVGVDTHPLGRRLFRKSLHGIGLPAKIVVPDAFDDGRDFYCKYCDDRDHDD